MKKRLFLLVMVMMSMTLQAQTTLSLNGKWQFRYVRDAVEGDSLAALGFGQKDFSATGFGTIDVPSCWAVLGYEEPYYGHFNDGKASEGFYILHFTPPASFKDKRVRLHFGGVFSSAEVWLNGHWLGTHESGFTSFTFDATEHFVDDGENTLAVRVRQISRGFLMDTYDDWVMGGIFRDVTLEAIPMQRWISRVVTHQSFSSDYRDAVLQVSTFINDAHPGKDSTGKRLTSPPYRLRVTLTDPNGRKFYDKTEEHPGLPKGGWDWVSKIEVKDAQLWTAETPYLYKVCAELFEDGVMTQHVEKKIGLREISTTDGVFKINGQPVKLRGVNRHDEWPDVGRATHKEHWLKDLTMMKESNVNFIRACHYQHAKGFIEACDSIGMYVGEEISIGGGFVGGGPKEPLMYDPSYETAVMTRTHETVERDLDNPSIIYWSVGNEEPLYYMYWLVARTVNGLDGSRPCLIPGNWSLDLPREFGMISNHYGSYEIYTWLCEHSDRPIIGTEYAHAYGNDRFGGMAEAWEALHDHPRGAGGAVWMWADQGIWTPVKKRPEVFPGEFVAGDDHLRVHTGGWDGVTDSYRNPTPYYYEFKEVYNPVYPAVDTVTVPRGQRQAIIPIHNDYDFTTTADVDMAWSLFVDDREVDKGERVMQIAPHDTENMLLSLGKLGQLNAGQTAYVQLRFTRNGVELGRRAVTLDISDAHPRGGKVAVKVVEDNAQAITVKVGKSVVRFDRQTGLPSAITIGGKTIGRNLRPTVWHKLNESEDATIKNRDFDTGVDYENMPAQVTRMTVGETGDSLTVNATVNYVMNDSNSINADYATTFHTDGTMTVSYTLHTALQTNLLPSIGLCMDMSRASACTRWLGKGPGLAYPNRRTYPLLGVYDATRLDGCHDARWIEVDGCRVWINGYVDRDGSTSSTLRLLNHVLARAQKHNINGTRYLLPGKGDYSGAVTFTLN